MQKYKKPTIIAHRGASGEAPENTLSAIQKAIDIGVDYIEFDVRLTKDGIPVVIHDDMVFRTTGYTHARYVHDLTLDQIKTLDVGSWFDRRFAGETIPTLEEVLQVAALSQAKLMIEIKKGIQSPSTIVEAILKVLKTANFDPGFLKFGSFSVLIIQEIMAKSPLLNVMGIVEKNNKVKDFIDLGIKHMALWYQLITPGLIQMLQDKGITIWTFTVDDPETAHLLTALSVEGIITNQPSYIRNHIRPT